MAQRVLGLIEGQAQEAKRRVNRGRYFKQRLNNKIRRRTVDPHNLAVSMPIGSIARDLQHLLTRRITAYIVGVRDAKTITRWAKGDVTRVRSDDVERRLRVTYEISRMLLDHDNAEIVKAWFVSMNPELADRTPAQVIREGHEKEALDAARAFIAKA